jgi:phosphoribosylamine--glycine ligase
LITIEGPNTGGMGAYAPAPVLTDELMKRVEHDIFQPFLKGIAQEGFDFRGIIYFGTHDDVHRTTGARI